MLKICVLRTRPRSQTVSGKRACAHKWCCENASALTYSVLRTRPRYVLLLFWTQMVPLHKFHLNFFKIDLLFHWLDYDHFVFQVFGEIAHLFKRTDRFFLDFEKPLWIVIREIFPHVDIKGCAFHFTQTLYRNIQRIGLEVRTLIQIQHNQGA